MQISDGSLRSRLRRRLINCMVIYTYVKNQLATFIEGEERRADLCNIFCTSNAIDHLGDQVWCRYLGDLSEA